MSASNSTHPLFTPDTLTKITSHALAFLETGRATENYTASHLESVLAAAKMALLAPNRESEGVMQQTIGVVCLKRNDFSRLLMWFIVLSVIQMSGRTNVPLRVWSALALATLTESSKNPALLMHTTLFGISYSSTLNSINDQLSLRGTLGPSAGSEVSHGYAAIKLWILLAQRVGDRGERDDRAGVVNSDREQRRIWNEAWPPFEKLLNLSTMNSDETSLVRTKPSFCPACE